MSATRNTFAVTALLFSLLSIFTFTNASLSQACTHPDRSPIDWRPKANDSRIFQVGHDPNNPREIRVHIPPNYNGSNVMLPVILAFHDKDMSTGDMEYESRLSDGVANEEFIVVYPTAKNVGPTQHLQAFP
jgi:poly(3-hydroxybutyrate) depolymerase